jgi:lysophospholipase L1-like esterase
MELMYVSCLEYLLKSSNPGIALDFISIGLSSETVSCLSEKEHPFPRPCLLERLERAVIQIQPDIIVACYGMNDGIYHPWTRSIQKAFKKGISELKVQAKQNNAKLVLITPPPFDTMPIQDRTVVEAPDFSYARPYQNYDQTLARFSNFLTKQQDKDIYVVDWHSRLASWLHGKRETNTSYSISKDGIHPGGEGHLMMARLLLQGLGMGGDEPKALEWDHLSSDPLFLQMDEIRSSRSLVWRNYIGYTRGTSVKSISPKPIMILMGGQSNMVGSGHRKDLATPNVAGYHKYYNFGLNAQLKEDPSRFGPEMGLSKRLSETFPDQPFIFLKYAVGGSSMLDWAVDYSKKKAMITGQVEFGNMFETFLQKIDSVQSYFNADIAALLWMQGERDALIPEAGQQYEAHFLHFIESLRSRLGLPELPIVMGLINPPGDRYPALEKVRRAQMEIGKRPFMTLINTDSLSKWPDRVHYDTKGQLGLGALFGEEMKLILEKI